ncbi:3209_t:CDS:2 [Dentiscutata heterogama]|uniref:3209_t:CDS:1 n=1 Tax=Dentiscutata heterogama TaxID=1316150 RepID=A0ACA9LAE3_9GLOM|nr:3209_t:CDS:2 [Dentiscutata heterogama]
MTSVAAIQIGIDLNILNFDQVTPTPCPFLDDQDHNTKIATAIQEIRDAARRSDRIEGLVHAFYLGSVIDKLRRGEDTYTVPSGPPSQKSENYQVTIITPYWSKTACGTRN